MRDEELRQFYAEVIARRTSPGREACLRPEALRQLVERKGSVEDRLVGLDHIGQCAECQAELEFFRVAQGESLDQRRWLLSGLAAAAMILLAATLLWRGRPSPPDELRGGSAGPELIAPRGRLAAGPPPTFVWRPLPGATGYAFELLDDHAATVFHTSGADTTLLLPDSVALGSGRDYRWEVRARLPSGETAVSEVLIFSIQAP